MASEDSTDESEREDGEFEGQLAPYMTALLSVLRKAPVDFDWLSEECIPVRALQEHQPRDAAGRATHAMRPCRIYMYGFAPSVSSDHVTACLLQFGPVARFRLFCDPVTHTSLRAASAVFTAAVDAVRVLEAAAKGMIHLAGLWAPEVTIIADPDGTLARRAYEARVHAPLPALLPLSYHGELQGPWYVQGGDGSAANAGETGKSGDIAHNEYAQGAAQGVSATAVHSGTCTDCSSVAAQICVSGLSSSTSAQAVKQAFETFGRVHRFVGKPPTFHPL